MTGALYALGRFCARHRLVAILLWLAAVIALGVLGKAAGQQTNDNLTLPGTGSQQATDILSARFPEQANGTNALTFLAPAGKKLTESKYENAIKQTATAYGKDKAVRKVVSPFSSAGKA